ncbi:hypothetical protein [Streptomyces olivaceus]|uniref:hypothetical protein n=1 Tax=Streptomyces olivaceus TaxID=47716 RepID=UPI0037BA9C90
MTPYERLMAEEIPTGTFGHARPPRPVQRAGRPWTAEEQDQHVADLLAALDGWHSQDENDVRKRSRHHLHLISAAPDQTPDAA